MSAPSVPEGIDVEEVLARVSDTVLVVDEEYRITYVNSRDESALGRGADMSETM